MISIDSCKYCLLRFFHVLKADFFSRFTYYGPFCVTLFCILFLFSIISGSPANMNFYLSFYSLVIFVGVPLVAGGAFKDVFKTANIHDWLLLPASTFEKVLSRLIFTFPVYLIVVNAVFVMTSLVSYLWSFLVHNKGSVLFDPFSVNALSILPHLVLLHSVFFFGASVFRKSPFFKTVLSIVLLFTVLFIAFSVVLVKMITEKNLNVVSGMIQFSLFAGNQSPAASALNGQVKQLSKWASLTIQSVYFVLLPLFFWTVPFIRMRKLEAQRAL